MLSLDHIALNVQSLERSRDFYHALGGKVVSSPSERFMEMELGGVILHLLPLGGGQHSAPQGIHHFALKVDTVAELERICDLIQKNEELAGLKKTQIQESPKLGIHGHVERQPPTLAMYFCDPDGNQIEVRSY
jgi:catechol-2,3-dioxygenase